MSQAGERSGAGEEQGVGETPRFAPFKEKSGDLGGRMIATDHAPHSAEEKGRGLEKSAMGIVGLETAFPALYTELVLGGVISPEKLVEFMSLAPAKRFGADLADCWALMDVESEYKIDPEEFVSMGRATPFAGKTVRGKCVMTAIRGEIRFFAEPIFTDVEDRGSDLASEPRPEA